MHSTPLQKKKIKCDACGVKVETKACRSGRQPSASTGARAAFGGPCGLGAAAAARAGSAGHAGAPPSTSKRTQCLPEITRGTWAPASAFLRAAVCACACACAPPRRAATQRRPRGAVCAGRGGGATARRGARLLPRHARLRPVGRGGRRGRRRGRPPRAGRRRRGDRQHGPCRRERLPSCPRSPSSPAAMGRARAAGRRGSAGKKSGASGRRLRDGFARGAGGASAAMAGAVGAGPAARVQCSECGAASARGGGEGGGLCDQCIARSLAGRRTRSTVSTSPPSKQQQEAGSSRHDGANSTDSEHEGASCSDIRKRAELLAAAKCAKGKRAPRVPGVSWHSAAKKWTVYATARNAHGKTTQLHLGYFQTKADAIERRLRYDAARKGKQKQTPAQRKGSHAEAMGEATRQRDNSQLTTTAHEEERAVEGHQRAPSDKDAHAPVGTGACAACAAGAAGAASADGAGVAAGGSGCALAVTRPALPAATKVGGAAAGAADNAGMHAGGRPTHPSKRRRTSTHARPQFQRCVDSSGQDGAEATGSEVEGASRTDIRERAERLAESGEQVPGVWSTRKRWYACTPTIRGKEIPLGSFHTKADAIERRLRFEDARRGKQKQTPAQYQPSQQQQGAGRSRHDCAEAPHSEAQTQIPAQPKQRHSEASDAATRCESKRRHTRSHAAPQQQRAVGSSEDDGAAPPRCEGEGTKSNERRKRAELIAESGLKVVGVRWGTRQRRWIVRIRKGNGARKQLGSFVKKADAIERRLRYDDAQEGEKPTPGQRNNSQLTTTPAAPPAGDFGTPDQGGQIFQTQSGTRDLDANAERASNLADSLQRSAREAVVLTQEMRRLIAGLRQENDALRKKHRDLEQTLRLSHARNEEATHVNVIDDGGCARTRSYRWCARKRR